MWVIFIVRAWLQMRVSFLSIRIGSYISFRVKNDALNFWIQGRFSHELECYLNRHFSICKPSSVNSFHIRIMLVGKCSILASIKWYTM